MKDTFFSSAHAKIRARCRCPSTRPTPCIQALKWAPFLCVYTFSVCSGALLPTVHCFIPITPCYAHFSKRWRWLSTHNLSGKWMNSCFKTCSIRGIFQAARPGSWFLSARNTCNLVIVNTGFCARQSALVFACRPDLLIDTVSWVFHVDAQY